MPARDSMESAAFPPFNLQSSSVNGCAQPDHHHGIPIKAVMCVQIIPPTTPEACSNSETQNTMFYSQSAIRCRSLRLKKYGRTASYGFDRI